MKKTFLISMAVAVLLCLSLLAGCAQTTETSISDTTASDSTSTSDSASTSDSTSESAPETTESASDSSQSESTASDSSVAETFSAQELDAALNSCCDFELGTAGGSLKAMVASSGLVLFAVKNDTADNQTAIDEAVQTWYDALETSVQETLKTNWESIYGGAQSLVSDPASMKDQLDEAGIADDFTTMDLTNGLAVADCLNTILAD